MFQCCCDFIRNCSSANFDVPDECVGKITSCTHLPHISMLIEFIRSTISLLIC